MKTIGKSTLAASAIALFFASPTFAADLGTKGDPTAADYTAPANWSGPWIGVVGGLTFFNTELDYTKDHVSEGERTNISHLNIDGLGAEGLFGEVQIGYDHQIGSNLVIGIFAGANLSDAEFSASQSFGGEKFASVTTDYEWGGVVGGRLGVIAGQNTLFYGAAGYAFAQLGDTDISFDGETESLGGPDLQGWFGEVGMEHRLSRALKLTVAGRYTDYSPETLWSGGSEYCPEEIEIDVDNLSVLIGVKATLNVLDGSF
jgi:outer membrane immunogenic protein